MDLFSMPVFNRSPFLLCDWSTEVCDAALVSSLPPSSFRSSSQLSGSHAPSFAKLNRRDGKDEFLPPPERAVLEKPSYTFSPSTSATFACHPKPIRVEEALKTLLTHFRSVNVC
ncbi:Contactin-associated protein-like 4 [Takifugu flavidus]|uniref:Contactin-associated protein-like 4 n=1 Tax=Takifugu flavidus TaxID=433684 RepID=A0A5C6P122_9TELE|nr:Contactin-associated protein-like 4 [Takifugu flavidus]